MKALVTGSAGFVGRHVSTELMNRGYQVWLVDPADPDAPNDCLRRFEIDKTVYDLVVHAAARAPHRAAIDGQPASAVYNRLLDAAMFDWAIRTGQRRVLYLSSSAVYPSVFQRGVGDVRLSEDLQLIPGQPVTMPPDVYGWTKLAGEQMAALAADAGLPVHVVRPFSGYGEDQSEDFPFGAFIARAKRREDPFKVWGDGSQVRDWIHIDDVVRGALAVVDADVREPVNLCTGIGTSLGELAQTVAAFEGYAPEFEFDLRAPAGVAYRVGDPTRFHEIYTPRVSLAEGVARALERAEV